jgi:hypothetical protein
MLTAKVHPTTGAPGKYVGSCTFAAEVISDRLIVARMWYLAATAEELIGENAWHG